MPYKYLLKYRKTEKALIRVEAWPRISKLATEKEKNKPSFIIGSVRGPRTNILWDFVDESKKKYGIFNKRRCYTILYPIEDAGAINSAYRLGLAAAVVESAKDTYLAQYAVRYIMNTTTEEIWFWTSKLLGVLGNKIDNERVLNSLLILSGGKRVDLF